MVGHIWPLKGNKRLTGSRYQSDRTGRDWDVEGGRFTVYSHKGSPHQRHLLRQATQQGCLPSMLYDGVKETEKVSGGEEIFCTRPIRAAKAEEKSPTGRTSPTNQPRQDPFHLYSLSPHSPFFYSPLVFFVSRRWIYRLVQEDFLLDEYLPKNYIYLDVSFENVFPWSSMVRLVWKYSYLILCISGRRLCIGLVPNSLSQERQASYPTP
jgi:hypothetical protein